ncbi:MAG: hypothetical protein AMXMBFR6_03880 [Betaproteobacteria bacterium]|nr:hypothetical protein [Rhodocyclaceae bacterium]
MMKSFGPSSAAPQVGFGLVEVMVGMVIAMIGILAMTQIFALSEGQRRATTSGADAQSTGALAMFTLERELQMAGHGLINTNCQDVRMRDSVGNTVAMSGLPVTIAARNDTAFGGDVPSRQVTVVASSSSTGGFSATLGDGMATSASPLRVHFGAGFRKGDLLLISQPGKLHCTVLQVSATPFPLAPPFVAQAVSVPGEIGGNGVLWQIPHDPDPADAPFNPPNADNIAPPGGFDRSLATVRVMGGTMTRLSFFVQGRNLVRRDESAPAATPPTVIASNVVALEARYGLDLLPAAAPDGFVDTYTDVLPPNTPDNRIVAVRLAIVTRGTIPERVTVLNRANPNLIPLWDGGPILDVDSTNDPDARNFRYRVFQTTIPLRNGIWNN